MGWGTPSAPRANRSVLHSSQRSSAHDGSSLQWTLSRHSHKLHHKDVPDGSKPLQHDAADNGDNHVAAASNVALFSFSPNPPASEIIIIIHKEERGEEFVTVLQNYPSK